jgi:CheY-like chemotaxis protein
LRTDQPSIFFSEISDLADQITKCEDGDQVLAAYGALCPERALMDIEMKRMDGITATRNQSINLIMEDFMA